MSIDFGLIQYQPMTMLSRPNLCPGIDIICMYVYVYVYIYIYVYFFLNTIKVG